MAVIPKVCSANNWWSAKFFKWSAMYKLKFCASRSTRKFQVLRASEKFGNHWCWCMAVVLNRGAAAYKGALR